MLEHKDVYMGSLALGVMCVCAQVCAKALGAAHTMHIKSLISELRGTQFTEREVPYENLLRLSPSLRPGVNVLLLNLQWDRWGHLATWFHWSTSSQASWEAHYQ